MANVSFLRGTQSKLNALLAAGSGYTEGAFYLTTDSDRLYFAQSANELVHLNHNVIHVASVSALPTPAEATEGDFYYAKAENVLCTKVGSAWVQINKDTNVDTAVSAVNGIKVESSSDKGITVSFNIQQVKTDVNTGDTTNLAAIPVSFTIDRDDLISANNVDVGVATTAVTGGVKVATTGDGSSGTGFNVTGGDNVTVARDTSGNVSISALDTTYDIEATDNKIILNNLRTGDSDELNLASGNDAITVSAAADTITVTHKSYLTKAAQSTAATATPGYGGTFTVVDSITTDKGHVTGFNTKTVTIPASDNVTSTLSAVAGNKIHLEESNGDNYDVTLAAGTTGDIVLSTDVATDTITVEHKTYNAPSVTSADAIAPGHGTTFTVVDSITANNGHITGYKTKAITLPTDNNTVNTGAAISADNQGKLTVSVTDSKGDSVENTSGQVLYYEVNGQKVYNQGKIDFYTKEQIDSKMQGINALTYKGTVASNVTTETDTAKKALPTTGVAIGDTWKVAYEGTYGGQYCEVGDLLIATGTETNGVITSGLTWTYVPSGDDTDSQYKLVVANNTATLNCTTTGDDVGALTIAAGNDIAVSTSGSTITVTHEDFSKTNKTTSTAAPKYGETFTVVDTITTDNGHVTGINTKTVTIPASDDTTSVLSVAAGNKIHLEESNGDNYDVTLASGNDYIALASNTTNNTITATHKTYSTSLSATPGADLKPSHGGNFTVVTGVTRDSGGHLNGFTTQKVILPTDNNTTSSLSVQDNTITLTESNGDSYDVAFTGGTQIDIATENDGIKVSHAAITTTKKSNTTAAPGAGETVTVLDSIDVNNGHVTGYTNKVITLPADTTSAIAGKVESVTNGAKFTTTLTESNGDNSSSVLSVTSTSLAVSAGTNAMSINLVWGSFDN